MLFQQNNNIIIKSSMYELEIHRNRIIELERNCQVFEKKLSSLQEQQNFYASKSYSTLYIVNFSLKLEYRYKLYYFTILM